MVRSLGKVRIVIFLIALAPAIFFAGAAVYEAFNVPLTEWDEGWDFGRRCPPYGLRDGLGLMFVSASLVCLAVVFGWLKPIGKRRRLLWLFGSFVFLALFTLVYPESVAC
jgi:hypothetical protein